MAQTLGTGHGISDTSDNSAQDQTCKELAKQLDNNLSVGDWIGVHSHDPRYQVLTDLDIIEQVTCTTPPLSTVNERDRVKIASLQWRCWTSV